MLSLILSCFLSFGAFAQKKSTKDKQPPPKPQVENILMKPIKAWKVSYQNKTNKQMVMEFLPVRENRQNWNQMVTLNVFYHASVTLKAIRDDMVKGFKRLCPASEYKLVTSEKVNNYDTEIFRVICPLSAATKRTEITHFKTVKGNDNVYMIQYASRLPPKVTALKKEQERIVYDYLNEVVVCDNRDKKHLCPTPIKI